MATESRIDMSTITKENALINFAHSRTVPPRGWFNVCDGCLLATHLTKGGCVVMEEGDPIPTLLCDKCKVYMLVLSKEGREAEKAAVLGVFRILPGERFREIRQGDTATNHWNALYLRVHSFGVNVVKGRILSRYDIPDTMLTIEGWATYLMQNPTISTFTMPTCEIDIATGTPTWTNQSLERIRAQGHPGEANPDPARPVFVGCAGCKQIGLVKEYITCTGCKRADYCSAECKDKGWVFHKEQCEPFCAIYKPISSSSGQR